MIYPAEADIVLFVKSLAEALQPYAEANEVNISFSTGVKKLVLQYQPFILAQTLIQLICNIINWVPPKSNIYVRLLYTPDNQNLQLEIQNTGINLIRVNEVVAQTLYSFTGYPLPKDTFYRLVLPINQKAPNSYPFVQTIESSNSRPHFYKKIQKQFRSHFTQTEKLIATLEQSRPQEAAFMQKINALITVNMSNENFDTTALCILMAMSRTQLFRRVKSLIKKAPAQYIKIMRLKKAKELLETTECTISEIACKTGFQTVSNFSKIYKEQYGIPPSVFRRKNQSATNE